MKTNKLTATSIGLAALWLAGGDHLAFGAHELLYGLTTRQNLISFYSDAPGTILVARSITGLEGNEKIRGIDFGANGFLYGVSDSSRLYTINPATGQATQVGSGQFTTLLDGQAFGVDVGPAGLLVTSDLGQSLLIDTTTAAVTVQPSPTYAAGDPHFGQKPRITALAHNPVTDTWIAGDSLLNSLATLTPATGLLNTLGPTGIDFSKNNGLDISLSSGILYLASPAASSDPAANLYTINPVTGAATLVGLIGNPGDNILMRGLAVSAPPTITCPSDTTVGTDPGVCTAVVNFTVTASDGNGPVNVVSVPPSGSTFPKGTTTVVSTATDQSGSKATCSFKVTVLDKSAPVVNCAAVPAQTAIADANCVAVVPDVRELVRAQSVDNCTDSAALVITQNPLPGGTVQFSGSHPISVTVCDTATPVPNCTPCTVQFTVLDGAPPSIGSVSVDTPTLSPPDHKMHVVTVNYTATDKCGPVTCVLSVTSNEPVNGPGDGNTTPDWVVLDSNRLQLRAERSGTGRGRVYTITITCTNNSGNSVTSTVTVNVPR